MKVLLGECTGRRADMLEALGWGRMWVARDRFIYTYPGEPWGFDNGAFRDWSAGLEFDEVAYQRALERAVEQPNPALLAVLPDIVAGGMKSLDFSLRWLGDLGPVLPWYLAVQDGMTPEMLPALPDSIVGIFLGGTSEFKGTAEAWCGYAHAHGLRFHYGRAGTMAKVAHALRVGADSLDSAFPMWTSLRWMEFEEAIQFGPPQHELFG